MSLHDEIINIEKDTYKHTSLNWRDGYDHGYHDAKHAAAELALKADAEIERLLTLIDEHNKQCICNKEQCGYAGYKRDCPDCPKQWLIDI